MSGKDLSTSHAITLIPQPKKSNNNNSSNANLIINVNIVMISCNFIKFKPLCGLLEMSKGFLKLLMIKINNVLTASSILSSK